MIKWLKSFVPRWHYTYGTIIYSDGHQSKPRTHRFNNRTGEIEFILWCKGEHGHKEDYWHRSGIGWVEHFTPEKVE